MDLESVPTSDGYDYHNALSVYYPEGVGRMTTPFKQCCVPCKQLSSSTWRSGQELSTSTENGFYSHRANRMHT